MLKLFKKGTENLAPQELSTLDSSDYVALEREREATTRLIVTRLSWLIAVIVCSIMTHLNQDFLSGLILRPDNLEILLPYR